MVLEMHLLNYLNMKIICAFDSFKGCMTAKEACQASASGLQVRYPEKQQNVPVHLLSGALEDYTELEEAGFASLLSINENDNRPLDVLMQKDVAKENLLRSIQLLSISSMLDTKNRI